VEPQLPPIEQWDPAATVGDYLAARAQYRAACKEWKVRRDAALNDTYSYRYAVGVVSVGFMVYGEGDTWEEAFRKAAANGRGGE
jgi:hypothetical protein